MSLRILFADDSMTAQNMGKKILTEAGYDVVAVSNGAAAVKKIAEQKPDIIILDVYMPGYSGLEVCEKVRGSLDTLKTPVLLTVGKMEPYKPEDANRVKADGVIIKPFEASDLLAIVKKFEERISNMPPPMVAQPVLADNRYEEEVSEPVIESPAERSKNRPGMQPLVEVPDHMASSAAFGDMLGTEPPAMNHFAVNSPSAIFETSVIVPAPPVPAAEPEVAVPVREEPRTEILDAAPVQEEPAAAVDAGPELVATPGHAVHEPPSEPLEHVAEAAEVRRPPLIPVFKEPELEPTTAPATEQDYAFIPTSAPPIGDLEIPREPALQETAEETTRSTKVEQVEPGLISTIGQQVESLSTRPVPEPPPTEAIPVLTDASDASGPVETSAPAPAGEVTDADFEARVAAAMAAYAHTTESDAARDTAGQAGSVALEAAPLDSAQMSAATQVHREETPAAEARAAAAPIPSFEYQPPVRSAEPLPADRPASSGAPVEPPYVAPPIPPPFAAETADPMALSAGVEAALPEAAAAVAAQTGAEHHTIAQAVHRVMERLKPELVEEIMKELKGKK